MLNLMLLTKYLNVSTGFCTNGRNELEYTELQEVWAVGNQLEVT
jgi:hypothetical protein